MAKPLNVVTNNVEYIALALGGAFVVFMSYRYIINSPSVEVGGRSLSAGQVDPYIAETLLPQLESRMNAPGRPEIALPTFDQQFRLAFSGPPPAPLDGAWTTARGLNLDLPTGTGTTPSRLPTEIPVAPGGPVVSAVPTLPAGIPIGTIAGLSLVNTNQLVPLSQLVGGPAAVPPNMMPPGGGALGGPFGAPPFGGSAEFGSPGPGDPNAGAAGEGGRGLAPRTPVRPATPPAGTTPAPAAPTPGQADRTWVSAAFELPMEALANTFVDANVPAGLVTLFLRVEVQREELQPDGSWGNATIVRPLPGSPLAANPLPAPGNIPQETNYRIWAEANQSEILHPSFYTVLGGAPWRMPGTASPMATSADTFDPRQYLEGPIPADLTKEQRDAVMRERAREAARRAEEERQRRREQNRNRPPPGMGGPPGGFPGGWPGGPGFPGGPGGPGGRGGRGGGAGGFVAPVPPKFSLAQPPAEAGFTLPGAVATIASGPSSASHDASGHDHLVGHHPWTLPTSFLYPLVRFDGLLAGLSLQTGGYGPPAQRPPGYPPNLPWPPPGFVPPTLPGGIRPPGMPGGPEFPRGGEETRPGAPTAPAEAVPTSVNLGQVPPGAFDPSNWATSTVIAVSHDDSVQPGKTYRYRMRYIMLNPVYGQPAAAAEPRIAQQFRWESEWSGWTDAVTVPSRVSFFVAAPITTGANTVSFEVFQFVRGRMTSRTFQVQPGDVIGVNDPTSGNFSTGHVLVDVRRDPSRNENYALILTPEGNLIRRDGNDRTSQSYLELRRQLSAPGPVGAAGN